MKTNRSLVLIALTVISAYGCGRLSGDPKTSGDPPVSVTVSEVRPVTVSYYDSYPGNVVALKQVEIHSEVSGYVTGIFFKEGSRVQEGQKLYEIDRRQYEAAYNEARYSVQIAESNLERVRLDVDRYTSLSRQDAIAKQQLDHALADLQDARLRVSSANEELIRAKTNYEYSLITAPFDGTIGISQVKMGTLAVPGQTLLNTISSDDPSGIDFEIGEKELGRFRVLQTSSDPLPDTLFRILLPDGELYPHGGKIDLIDRAVNPQTGTITVRLTIPNPDRTLRPGMSCVVKILHEAPGQQIVIPLRAVTEKMGEYFVFRVSGDTVSEIRVGTGARIGPNVVITSGLQPMDRIVVEGTQKIRDGSAVTTVRQTDATHGKE